MSTENLIEFDGVGLRYGTDAEVLKNITFNLPVGSFHFLTGESGAGKTSLLSLLYLAQSQTRGQVRMFGKTISVTPREDLPELRRRIGVVFQDFRLLDHLSIFDNVALPLRLSGMSEADIKKRVVELLNWVGLGDRLKTKPEALSGGQKQSVAICRAIINRPELLLADEPTGNMDDKSALRLLRLFEELNKRNTTIVIATHNENLIKAFNFPRMHLTNGRLAIYPAGFMPQDKGDK
ncbi:MAG: cell division ATP-binding protein FtsE [Alphaproteobacteria bacterium]|nr:cell division ATP-binding protein FtsE [Alphaproteobacteria bacterium]